jgi:2-dehydro-3-deoxyphosphogalactonate aldolase
VIKAWKAVLPKHINIYAVGGVTPENMGDWLSAGAAGFGIGSSIYKPGMTVQAVRAAADKLVSAWLKAKGQ